MMSIVRCLGGLDEKIADAVEFQQFTPFEEVLGV